VDQALRLRGPINMTRRCCSVQGHIPFPRQDFANVHSGVIAEYTNVILTVVKPLERASRAGIHTFAEIHCEPGSVGGGARKNQHGEQCDENGTDGKYAHGDWSLWCLRMISGV
jgi:hypothetical protein